ncbi:MAG: hypothetical protein JWR48_5161 [Mycobacterium sp.]|nr:hypothetical protein [Mycobacterium sp.]
MPKPASRIPRSSRPAITEPDCGPNVFPSDPMFWAILGAAISSFSNIPIALG